MKDFLVPTNAAGNKGNKSPDKKDLRGKLSVAYLNKDLINTSSAAWDTNSPGYTMIYKPSVFSTTGGYYYVDGIQVSLSQDEEAMYYEGKLSEYY